MSKKLPIITQVVVYRRGSSDYEFLLLKRTEERGGFWNVVNGTLEMEESVLNCRSRELSEEAGITEVLTWSSEINRFSFARNDIHYTVIVFAAEVAPDAKVIINNEHLEFRWVSSDQAKQHLSFDEDRKSIDWALEIIRNTLK